MDIFPDTLYFVLEKLPPDLQHYTASEEQVLVAFAAFRQALGIPAHLAKYTEGN